MPTRPLNSYGNMGPDAPPEDTSAQTAALAADDAPGADPYANPTNYRSFSQTFNANAGSANASAQRLAQKVRDEQGAAARANAKDYADFQSRAQKGMSADGTSYGGPDAYAPSESTYAAFDKAAQDTKNLGSTYGVQASLGPGASLYSATLTQHAGAPAFAQVQAHGAKVAAELPQDQAQGDALVKKQRAAAQAGASRAAAAQNAPPALDANHLAYQRDMASPHNLFQDAKTGEVRDPTYEEWLALAGTTPDGNATYIDPNKRGY